ncbi:MAG: plasmid stabilization system protein ParE [bacterium]|jgi:plasmid stabilization system protein ParE
MKNYNLIITPEAQNEIIEAYKWYESKSEGLGKRFFEALDVCFDSIKTNPTTYQKIHLNYRQALMKVFPFVVIYEQFNTDLVIFAVFNTYQDPQKKIKP